MSVNDVATSRTRSLLPTVIVCIIVSVVVQISLPYFGRLLLNLDFGDNIPSTDQGLSTTSKENVLTFFEEPFPVNKWKDSQVSDIVARRYGELEDKRDPVREREALAALSASRANRKNGNIKKAMTVIEHAFALAPTHPDVLTEYGRVHEHHKNILDADLCYVKALHYNPTHTEALILRQRTQPLVSRMDERLLRRVREKRDEFSRLSHTSTLKRAMRESYFLHIYHTVAIEGNTLTLGQTRSILESGMVVPGKSIMEHNEVLGMDSALRFLNQSLISVNTITINDILQMHRRVLGYVNPADAGTFRSTQVFVGRFTPVSPDLVKEHMDQLIEWLNAPDNMNLDPIQMAAIAHYKLVLIHPFVDGNGRTGRLLMNLLLMRAGYPPVILPVESRAEYYATLNTANMGDLRPFVRYVAIHTERTLREFIGDATGTCSVEGGCTVLDSEGEGERIESFDDETTQTILVN